MANHPDDFFEAFKKKTVTKVEKFSFKKVEKNNPKPKVDETVSGFFKKVEKTEKSKEISVEDQFELLFSDSSTIGESPVKKKCEVVNKNSNSSIKNERGYNGTYSNSTLAKQKLITVNSSDKEFTKNKSTEKNVKTQKDSSPVKLKFKNIFKKSTSSNSHSTPKISPQKNAGPPCLSSKFQFKKKNVDNVASEVFESLFGEKFIPKKLHQNEKSKDEESVLLKNGHEPEIMFKNRTIDNVYNESLNDLNSSTDSPVTRQKKFTFKKPIISESSSSSSPSPSFLSTKLIHNSNRDSIVSLNSNDSKRDSIILISSAENTPVSKNKKPSVKNSILNDEVGFVSQSLAATEGDYMDDETFEKLFGEKSKKSDKEVNLILENINWDEDFTQDECSSASTSTSKNTEKNYIAEISAIDWNEEPFKSEEGEEPYIPEISFKDREEHLSEFQGQYHFSLVMEEVLHQKFGLQTFRPQQREVINATLNQHDCFVLMPTGGGKSLCYQLPAVLSEGVSIVISPLRALIGDQVDKMNELDIPAAHLCQDVGVEESGVIMTKLHCREPLIKLLYLTPEKIMASRIVSEMLKNLYQRGKLARFIIDEAHCLSQWGHDFRPDYKQLSFLKNEFKSVPIMCLTATATKQVENDVISILKLKNVKRFIMSFNRPNIKYQVVPKKGKLANEEIIGLIKKKFLKKSGIIYCLARNDCESLADVLNNSGVKARPYHAGLAPNIRNAIQKEWMQDRFFVIVATIAFGMGIDKPDVRFVIHNSIPKSVEAFYQESGRAGRDGDISYSYLFYNYSDVLRLQKIMQMERKKNARVLEGHFNSLKQMVSFAENVVDCRRYLQLIHLGENFDRQLCVRNKATTCDNCENINAYDNLNVTKEAKELGVLVKDLSQVGNVTMLHVADVYKGSKIKKILQMGHNKHKYYGAGSSMDRTDIHRILKDLVLKNILGDHVTYTGDFPVVYIRTGNKFDALNARNLQISIPVNRKSVKKIISSITEDDSYETSTTDSNENTDSRDTPGPSKLPPLAGVGNKKATYSAFNKTKINNLKVQCHEALLEECRRMALERNLTLSSIMNLTAIKTMSDVLPKTKEDFVKIQHVTAANYKKCGENFLAITKKFRQQVDALDTAPKIPESSSFELDDSSIWSSQSSQRGTKRKSTGGYKKWGNKKRKTYRKKKSPAKKKTTTTSKKGGWTKKKGSGGGGGGGLGMMPIHFK